METLEMPVSNAVQNRDNYFEALYEQCFPIVARFVSSRKGSLQDAKDIFHDALIIYHEKSLKEGFRIEVSPEAYVLGISRNLWARKFDEVWLHDSVDDHASAFAVSEDFHPNVNENFLLHLLEKAGKKCLSLLMSFYFEKANMSQLKERFGFSSERSATVQKYKCIEKIRETIKQKSLHYEDFLE